MTQEIVVRFAGVEDEASILAFLRDHWSHDHIFVTNSDVMRWQHRSPDYPDDELTFILAQRATRGEVLALLGYMPTRRFDPSSDWTEVALAIWKIRDDIDSPGLGLHLLKTIQRKLEPDMIYAIGITPIARPIYKALGFSVGTLSHVALFAEQQYSSGALAAGVPANARWPIPQDPAISFVPVSGEKLPEPFSPEIFDRLGAMSLPRKSWAYVYQRYIQHPWYKYDISIVCSHEQPQLILIWRRVLTPFGDILRIVDAFGHIEIFARCGSRLREALAHYRCDYIDLVFWGDYLDTLNRGGFISTTDHQQLVLPAHFSPYEHKNVAIEFAFKCSRQLHGLPVRLHRADSDQDRPSRPIELFGL